MPDTNVPIIRKLTDELAAGDFVWWPRPDGSEVPATVERAEPCIAAQLNGCWLVTNTFGGSMHVNRNDAWRTATTTDRLGIPGLPVDDDTLVQAILDYHGDLIKAHAAQLDRLQGRLAQTAGVHGEMIETLLERCADLEEKVVDLERRAAADDVRASFDTEAVAS